MYQANIDGTKRTILQETRLTAASKVKYFCFFFCLLFIFFLPYDTKMYLVYHKELKLGTINL